MAALLSTPSVSPILDDRPTIEDALDFAPYRDTLVDILRNPSTRTPLTVGLFGTWGSGKTSLMRMIKARIDAAGLPAYRTAWFNAWKYDREEALWRALILQVLDALRPRKPDNTLYPEDELGDMQRSLVHDLDRLEESLYRTVEWEEVGRWTLDWVKALRGTAEGAAEIALAFVPGGAPLVNLAKKAAQVVAGEGEEAIADAFRREVKTYRREQLRSLEQFERGFQELLKRHVLSLEGRLIVFVDDLDRCLPEKTIEVLEAIKLFLDVPGCVFVLALDHEAIVEAIQTRYEGEVKGRQYLEKIIQLPFLLPPIETENMRDFVKSLVPHLPDPHCGEVFAEGLPRNPRKVKRTINIFLLLWNLSRERLSESIQPVRLAKVVTIQHSHPDLYALLREVPRLLRDLEAYFRAEADLEGVATPDTPAEDRPEMLLLPPQLQTFIGRTTLRSLLTLHPADTPDFNFIDLTPQDIRPYIYLAHRVEPRPEVPIEVPQPQMVRIPAGEFTMGGKEYDNEQPVHKVHLPEFQIGRYPVTNYEYRVFVRDTGVNPPLHWEGSDYPEMLGDHPVIYVNWYDAVAYCQWLSEKTGKSYRLPTEAEWEKAARGTDGRRWPWGNEWDTRNCNSKESGLGCTTPPGQYSPRGDSPYGVADMAGNVKEWCNSLLKSYPYQGDDGREDLAAKDERVLRSGAFSDEHRFVRCAFRQGRLPNSRDRNLGFRVALPLPSPSPIP
jgi:formylglycine-generating enzyme required for sulfatase activity